MGNSLTLKKKNQTKFNVQTSFRSLLLQAVNYTGKKTRRFGVRIKNNFILRDFC